VGHKLSACGVRVLFHAATPAERLLLIPSLGHFCFCFGHLWLGHCGLDICGLLTSLMLKIQILTSTPRFLRLNLTGRRGRMSNILELGPDVRCDRSMRSSSTLRGRRGPPADRLSSLSLHLHLHISLPPRTRVWDILSGYRLSHCTEYVFLWRPRTIQHPNYLILKGVASPV